MQYNFIDTFRLRLQKKTVFMQALYANLIVVLIFCGALIIGFIVGGQINSLASIIGLIVGALAGSIVYLGISIPFYVYFFKIIRKKVNEAMGKELSPEESIELRIWFRTGQLSPAVKDMQLYVRFLDYIRPFIYGERVYSSRALAWVVCICALFQILQKGFDISIHPTGSSLVFDIIIIIVWLLLLFLLVPIKSNKRVSLYRLINKRAIMRYQSRLNELGPKKENTNP